MVSAKQVRSPAPEADALTITPLGPVTQTISWADPEGGAGGPDPPPPLEWPDY